MRPSVIVLGFVLGSAAAISFALVGVVVVFGLLRGEHPRLEAELPSLLVSGALFLLLTLLAGLSFYGQLRGAAWRRIAVTSLLAGLAFIAWYHWPA